MLSTPTIVILSSLGTLLMVSIARDINHHIQKNKFYPEHRFQIGDRVICNRCNGKPVMCEIIELMRYIKDNKCCYKALVHYSDSDIRVETISEGKIQCTELQFGIRNSKLINK